MEEGAKFCPECGAQISPTEPEKGVGNGGRNINYKLITAVVIIVVVGALAAWFFLFSGHPAADYAKMIPGDASRLSVSSGAKLRAEDWETPEELDIDEDAVKYVASGGGVNIYDGSFNLEDVRDELEDRDYEEDKYKGVEVWESEDEYGEDDWVAFLGGKILTGQEPDVEKCIEVVEEGDDSFVKNEDAKRVLDRLKYNDQVRISIEPYEQYEDLEAGGGSRKMLDDDAEKWDFQSIYLFDDADAADDAIDEIESDIEDAEDEGDIDYADFQISRSGNIVEIILKEYEWE